MPDGMNRMEAMSRLADRDAGPMGGGGSEEQAAQAVMQAAQLLTQAAQMHPPLEPAVRQAIADLQAGVSAIAGGPPVRGQRRPRVGYSVSVAKGGKGRGTSLPGGSEEEGY